MIEIMKTLCFILKRMKETGRRNKKKKKKMNWCQNGLGVKVRFNYASN